MPIGKDLRYASALGSLRDLWDFSNGEHQELFISLNKAPAQLNLSTDTVVLVNSYLEGLDFLSTSSKLTNVVIERCIIQDWKSLKMLTNLENLYIESSNPPDSSVVADMSHLRKMGLVDCDLKETEGLRNKPLLEFVDVSYNREVESLEAIKYTPKIQWLRAERTGLNSLEFYN